MIQIVTWSDYACPFCYIADTRLHNIVKDMGIADKISWNYRSYELYPETVKNTDNTFMNDLIHGFFGDEGEAKRRAAAIDRMAKTEGLAIDYGSAYHTNTFDAHRLTQYAMTLGDLALTEKVRHLLFSAVFEKQEKISDPRVLMKIAEEAGLPLKEADDVIHTEAFADKVHSDESFLKGFGVNGVPYIVINGQAIMGAQPRLVFQNVLKKAVREDSSQN